MKPNLWTVTGALSAAMAVGLGAFGAHWLEANIGELYEESELQLRRLDNWETAVRYQVYHALGLILLGLLSPSSAPLAGKLSGSALLAGSIIFSGCLYLLVLTNFTLLGAIVAIGGLLQIMGWLLFALAAWRVSRVKE